MSEQFVNHPPDNQTLERSQRRPVQSDLRLHNSQQSAVEAVEEAMQVAKSDGRWMVAVWSIRDGRLYLDTRTTWDFPRGDYDNAVKQLQRDIESEGMLPAGVKLPLADLPPLN